MMTLFEAHYCSPVFVTLTFQTVHWQLLATPQYGSRLSRRGCASGSTSGSWSPRPSSPIASSTSEPRRFSRKKFKNRNFRFAPISQPCITFMCVSLSIDCATPLLTINVHPNSTSSSNSVKKMSENQVGKAKNRRIFESKETFLMQVGKIALARP